MAQAGGGLEAQGAPGAQADLFPAVMELGRAECVAAIEAALEAAAARARLATATATDSDGDTLLHMLVWKNPDAAAVKEAVQTLVAAGADVRAKGDIGREPLHCAALNQNAEAAAAAVRVLLVAGADVRAKSESESEPLHYAACNQNAEAAAVALRLLVAAGADVRARNNNGWEPLHHAAVNQINAEEATAVVQALVAAGADVRAKANDGRTPLRMALQRPRITSAAAIVRAGPAGAVLEDLCSPDATNARQLFPEFVASHVPLTKRQWASIPTACPGLGRALPAALASSDEQAGLVVCRLPPADSERLRTFAQCVARRQRSIEHRRERSWPQYLPPAVVKRILSFFDA